MEHLPGARGGISAAGIVGLTSQAGKAARARAVDVPEGSRRRQRRRTTTTTTHRSYHTTRTTQRGRVGRARGCRISAAPTPSPRHPPTIGTCEVSDCLAVVAGSRSPLQQIQNLPPASHRALRHPCRNRPIDQLDFENPVPRSTLQEPDRLVFCLLVPAPKRALGSLHDGPLQVAADGAQGAAANVYLSTVKPCYDNRTQTISNRRRVKIGVQAPVH